jgi:hypothetical protein
LIYYGPRPRQMREFHKLKNVKKDEKGLKIGQVLPILANFSQILMNLNHVLKTVGRGKVEQFKK